MTRTSAALLATLFVGGPAFAAGGFEYTPTAAPAPPDLGALVFRLVLLTAGLIGLCALVLWTARRAQRPTVTVGEGSGRLRHDGTLPLDRGCAVHLLSVDGLAVAMTTDATGLRSLVLLSESFELALEEEAEVPEAAPVREAAPETPASSAPVVVGPVAVSAPAAPNGSADDVRQLLERLVRRADRPGVHLEPALRDDQP